MILTDKELSEAVVCAFIELRMSHSLKGDKYQTMIGVKTHTEDMVQIGMSQSPVSHHLRMFREVIKQANQMVAEKEIFELPATQQKLEYDFTELELRVLALGLTELEMRKMANARVDRTTTGRTPSPPELHELPRK